VSASTGQPWRLPTVAEWTGICELGNVTNADEHAWHKGNSKKRTHKCRSRKPGSIGIHDLHGNVSEWCRNGPGEDDFVLMGACYNDGPESVTCSTRKTPDAAWNDTDPQIPRSVWWLADAPFAGFRVICETAPTARAEPDAKPKPDKADSSTSSEGTKS
jgi:formylglycine-generating enzyme required for sulfatase activity